MKKKEEFNPNDVWTKMFHPLKVGTKVRVKNNTWKAGYYDGKIMDIYFDEYKKGHFSYMIDPILWGENKTCKCSYYVEAKNIITVLEDETPCQT